jgi:catechol 2,3-dioxygenase-like lactoylglutathione lyase family enzyme
MLRTALLSFALSCAVVATADKITTPTDTRKIMELQSVYTVIVTDNMTQCRDFYTRWLGFEVVFESTWFTYLASTHNPSLGIAFMTPDHPSQPPGPETFNGKGMFVTLQVADAAMHFNRLKQGGVRIDYPLTEEAWGQRRFSLFDPSGTWVDVVEQIEPAPGYWDKYMK